MAFVIEREGCTQLFVKTIHCFININEYIPMLSSLVHNIKNVCISNKGIIISQTFCWEYTLLQTQFIIIILLEVVSMKRILFIKCLHYTMCSFSNNALSRLNWQFCDKTRSTKVIIAKLNTEKGLVILRVYRKIDNSC